MELDPPTLARGVYLHLAKLLARLATEAGWKNCGEEWLFEVLWISMQSHSGVCTIKRFIPAFGVHQIHFFQTPNPFSIQLHWPPWPMVWQDGARPTHTHPSSGIYLHLAKSLARLANEAGRKKGREEWLFEVLWISMQSHSGVCTIKLFIPAFGVHQIHFFQTPNPFSIQLRWPPWPTVWQDGAIPTHTHPSSGVYLHLAKSLARLATEAGRKKWRRRMIVWSFVNIYAEPFRGLYYKTFYASIWSSPNLFFSRHQIHFPSSFTSPHGQWFS